MGRSINNERDGSSRGGSQATKNVHGLHTMIELSPDQLIECVFAATTTKCDCTIGAFTGSTVVFTVV